MRINDSPNRLDGLETFRFWLKWTGMRFWRVRRECLRIQVMESTGTLPRYDRSIWHVVDSVIQWKILVEPCGILNQSNQQDTIEFESFQFVPSKIHVIHEYYIQLNMWAQYRPRDGNCRSGVYWETKREKSALIKNPKWLIWVGFGTYSNW